MADAGQFRKVKSIIEADPARKVIVVSAAGKRFKDDHKLTDLLYLCHAHKKYGVSCDPVFDMIADRYREICAELGLSVDIDSELSALREEIEAGISKDKLVSRGEYFSAKLMADFLGYDFLDAELWLHFSFDGTIDKERSYEDLERLASGRRIVTPGFYGAMPDGSIRDTSESEDGPILAPDTFVSMNLWGYHQDILPVMERYFADFLASLPADEMKAECLLPTMMGDLTNSGKIKISVLNTNDRWFGLTYKEDKPGAVAALTALHENGTYPPTLWRG